MIHALLVHCNRCGTDFTLMEAEARRQAIEYANRNVCRPCEQPMRSSRKG